MNAFSKPLILCNIIVLFASLTHAQQPAWLVDKQINDDSTFVVYKAILATLDNKLILGGTGRLSDESFDSDFVLRKTDLNGALIWEQQYGGTGQEELLAMKAAQDGYYLGGITYSDVGEDVSSPHLGEGDVWIVKVNLSGELVWEKRFGSNRQELFGNLTVLADGDVIMAAGKAVHVSTSIGFDFWTVRLESDGTLVWDKTFGGTEPEDILSQRFTDIQPSLSGGFLAIGYDDIITDRTNGISIWPKQSIISLDENGEKIDVQHFEGGQPSTGFEKLLALPSGEFIIFGDEGSSTDNTVYNFIARKFTSPGTLSKTSTVSGLWFDHLESVAPTTDGGFVAVGYSESNIGNDILDFNKGMQDGMVVKYDAQLDIEWVRLLGSWNQDRFHAVASVNDKIFAVGSGFDRTLPDEISTSNAGYAGWIVRFSSTIDAVPPAAVDGFVATNVTPCETTLVWNAVNDAYGYMVKLGDEIVYAGQDTTLKLHITADTLYKSEILALDFSLNTSAVSEIEFTTPVNVGDFTGYSTVIGGKYDEWLGDMVTDSHDNVILVGSSHLYEGAGVDVKGNITGEPKGDQDGLIVAFDQKGNKLWDLLYGGSSSDAFYSITTADNGYVVGGLTNSSTIVNMIDTARGGSDFFVVKTDQTGAPVWMHRYGGSGYDNLSIIKSLPDGGYILAGTTTSPANGDITITYLDPQYYWNPDILVFKIDATGTILWQQRLGGSSNESMADVLILPDNKILVVANTYSGISGNITEEKKGILDIWTVLLNGDNGEIEANHRYGGTGGFTMATRVKVVNESLIAIIGSTDAASGSGDVLKPGFGYTDFWMMYVLQSGAKVNEFRYGGTGSDIAYDATFDDNGAFIITGTTGSPKGGIKTEHSKGGADTWIVSADATGEVVWDKTYGGKADDSSLRLVSASSDPTSNGYWIAGHSKSGHHCDLVEGPGDAQELWLFKHFASQDSEAPEAPGNLHSPFMNTRSVKLDWDVPYDDHGVVSYNLYIDNVFAKSVTVDSLIHFATFQMKGYSFEVSAVDFSRKEGARATLLLDLNLVLEAEQPLAQQFLAYPVPFNRELTIKTPINAVPEKKILILNMNGQVVKTLNRPFTSGDHEYYILEGDSLAPALYLFKVVTNDGAIQGKIIKND